LKEPAKEMLRIAKRKSSTLFILRLFLGSNV
jgi:hypothetical protein